MSVAQVDGAVAATARKPLVLMAVFNALDFDGRVQRSAEALSSVARVKVLAVDGGRGFRPARYDLEVVPAAAGEFGANRALHWRFLRTLVCVARRERPALIYGHDFFMAFPAWIAARLSGASFVYDAHELIIPGSLGRSRGRLQERVWYTLERAVIKHADLVVAANGARADLMAKHYRLASVPTAVRNITAVAPSHLDDDTARQRYPMLRRRSVDECVCVYQGDVDLDRGLAALLEAFKLLPQDYRLLIVGGGPDVETIRAESSRSAARIDVMGKVPREDLLDILRLCDIGAVIYSFNGLNNVYCAPNKVFEYAQAGIPVVATAQPPLIELVERSGIGRVAGNAAAPTPREMAGAIEDVRANAQRYKRGLAPFLAAHQWHAEAERLRAAVLGVLNDARD